jgi:Fe-S oxidoreductase
VETVTIFKEGIDALRDVGGGDVKLCFQCALCTSTCPWNGVRSFPLRRMLRQGQFGLVELEKEDWWLCVTCGLCTSRCPRGVPIIDIMMGIRRIMVESGMSPESLRAVSASLASLGNPWGQAREKRTEWAEGLDVKPFAPGMELLYFPCCTAQYDPMARRIARSTVRILQEAGVDFGVLGVAEVCCGESIRKAGNEDLFHSLAQSNIKTFAHSGVTRIITSSPHCYYTFKNDYPGLGGRFEVMHFTQYLWELLSQERLSLSRELGGVVAYHDP